MKIRYYPQISLIIIAYLLLFSATSIYAAEESVTVTTYYPSPYGVYGEMRLYPKDSGSSPCQEGTMYYNLGNHTVMVCGSGNAWQTLGGGGYWNLTGNSLYPTNTTAWNVGIGTMSPGVRLDVNGQTRSSGGFTTASNSDAEVFRDVSNTGYYLDPANTGISLVTAGNVGIGTTSPAQGLHIAGSNSGGTRVQLENAGRSWAVQTTGSGFAGGQGNFAINEVGGGARLTIRAGGNVGIGTTSPSQKLDVIGNVNATDFCIPSSGKCLSSVGGGPGGGNVTISQGPGIKLSPNPINSTGTVSFETRNCPSGQFVSGINDVSALTCGTPSGPPGGGNLTGSGTTNYIPKWTGSMALGNSIIYDNGVNVGIGTTSPLYPIDIVLPGSGQVNALITRDPTNAYLSGIGFSSSSQQAGIVAQIPGQQWLLLAEAGTGNAYTIIEKVGAGYAGRLTVKPGGNIGINNMNPLFRLDVGGPIQSSDILTQSRTNDCPGGWTCTLKTWDISAASILISGYLIRSDARLKTDIAPLINSLDVAKQLQGVSYRWKKGNEDSGASIHYGFIAQDVEKVLPNLVHETPKGIKSIEMEGIIPVLTEALKEQQAQIESLKSRIDALEKK